MPNISDKQELLFARLAAGCAIVLAGWFGIHPPGFVAQVVAFAFGLAASSFFPVILMGIFYKRMNREGAIAGMVTGIVFTAGYIIYFKFIHPEWNSLEHWWLGISPEGIGTLGMLLNFFIALTVCRFTQAPPKEVQDLVDDIRIPQGASSTYHHH
jgi:cation/acetate symporter